MADLLRGNAFSVEMNYSTKSMSSLFKTASRKGAKFAIIVGEDEMVKKEVAIKNLKTQEQTLVKLEDLDNVLHTLLTKYYADRDAEEAKGE